MKRLAASLAGYLGVLAIVCASDATALDLSALTAAKPAPAHACHEAGAPALPDPEPAPDAAQPERSAPPRVNPRAGGVRRPRGR